MPGKKGSQKVIEITPATAPPRMPAESAQVVAMKASARLQMRGPDGQTVTDLTLTVTEGAACLLFVAKQRGVKLTPEQRAELIQAAAQHSEPTKGKQ